MKVFINPGHAPGIDPGAVNRSLRIKEAEVVLSIGKKVQGYLAAAGCEVNLLQADNLFEVCQTANAWGADVFVSLHCNAFDRQVRGTETLVHNLESNASVLARCIQRQVIETLRAVDPELPDRGLKRRPNLLVLRCTDMPAALVEIAFIDQPADARLLIERQDEIARAIARGVTDYAVVMRVK